MSFVSWDAPVRGQEQAGAVVLQVEPDARTNAMGKAGTASNTDAGALWWYPASMAFSDDYQVQFTHSNLVPGVADNIFFGSAAALFPIPRFGSLGASFSYITYGRGPGSYELAPGFSVAASITPSLAIGGTFKVVHVSYTEWYSGTTVAFDAGVRWTRSPVALGFCAQALGPDITMHSERPETPDASDPLPRALRVGISYQAWDQGSHGLLAAFDFNKPMVAVDDGPILNAGVEYSFRQLALARVGWVYEGWYSELDPINGAAAGLGVSWRGLFFDYATIPQAPDLDRVSRFTLGFRF
jgi:Type IX secretion system protein PorV